MNYDTIIVEMLSRIQALEEQVATLSKMQQCEDASQEKLKVTTADIRDYIDKQISEAASRNEKSVTFKALNIHNALKLTSRYPMVCNAMRQCMKEGDQIIFETQSGYSSTLAIQYFCDNHSE